ncbi:MAG: sensor histidine kinase [Actinomycetota bacterium]
MSATATTQEKSQSSGSAKVEPSGFRVLAWALFFGVLLLLGLASGLRSQALPTSVGELLLWIGLVAATSVVPLTSQDGPALGMDLPVLLGAAFLHGPIFAGLVGLIGCVDVRELRRQVSISRALLNRAQISLSAIVAAFVFESLGAHLGSWPWAAVAGLLAIAADCMVNYTLVAIAYSLLNGRPVSRVLREMSLGSAMAFVPVYVCFGFLGVLLAETYVRLSFIGMAGFVAPIVLARQGFIHWRRLDEARESIEAKNDALRSVDERIADERRDERARIAAALHDDVLQCLYNVTIRAQIIREDLRSGRLLDLDDDVPSLLTASEDAVEELRDIIGDLRRSTIGHAGLVDTLTLLVGHLANESGVHFVADLDATVKGDASTELLVYQVAREALTNTLKHSGARTVWVALRYDDGSIALTVEDDGCGFDPHDGRDSRHFGVELMRERARIAGGSLDLRSSPGAGTSIALKVPTRYRG